MKFTVAVLCLVVFASFTHGISRLDIIRAIQACKLKHDCQESLNTDNLPKTKEGFESIYCACEKLGVITTDNKVNGELMTSLLTKINVEEPAKVTAACESKCTGSDHAEAAKSLLTCIQNETKRS